LLDALEDDLSLLGVELTRPGRGRLDPGGRIAEDAADAVDEVLGVSGFGEELLGLRDIEGIDGRLLYIGGPT